jgi:TonB family protein
MPAREEQMLPGDAKHEEQAAGPGESRAHPRVKVHSLAYVELGEGNAGLILNISETGMAVQAVQMLISDSLPHMQFRLPKTDTLVEAQGNVIWQIRSKKEAGIRFAGLSDRAREAIRKWIAAELARQDESEQSHVGSQQGRPSRSEQLHREILSAREANNPLRESATPGVARSAPFARKQEAPAARSDWGASAPDVSSSSDEERGDFDATDRAPMPREPIPMAPPAVRRVPSRWRPEPAVSGGSNAGSLPYLQERLRRERLPGVPQWNGNMAAGVGMEFRKSHRWRRYTAAVGILAAVGFVALMILNPDFLTRARIDSLVQALSASSDSGQPTAQNSTNQTSSPVQNPSVAPSSSAAQAASQRGQSPPASPAARPTNAGTSETARANPQGSVPGASPAAASPGAQTGSNSPNITRTPAKVSSSSSPSRSNSYQAQANPPRYARNSNQSQSRSGERYRSQASSTQRSSGHSYGSAPANDQTQSYTPSGPDSGTHPARTANASLPAAPAPPVSLVEMPGYQSTVVPPSVPLAGVPSGSVGTTSQLHAIRIPANLQWARAYLPRNLGVGQLISSYSATYPIQAARAGIQGTVKLDVLVGTDGTVRSVNVLSGPPMLSSSAVSAVRDWRYAETFLAGQPIETEQYVVMVFGLSSGR